MATYSYKGQDFDIDHEPTPEEFAQIMAYIDSQAPVESPKGGASRIPGHPEQTAPEEDKRSTFGKVKDAYLGAHEILPTLATGAVAGLAGIPMGVVNAIKNGTNVKDEADKFVERNTYMPRTEEGQEYLRKLSPALESMQALGPFDPFHASAMVGRKGPKMKPMDAPKVSEVEAAVLKQKEQAEFAKKPAGTQAELFDTPVEGQASPYDAGQAGVTEPVAPKRARRQMGFDFGEGKPAKIEVDKTGEAVRSDADANTLFARDEYARKIEAEFEAALAAERAKERPGVTSQEGLDGQMALFEQGDQMGQRNQFNAGDLGDWRIDENGMPVRVDKSMEGQNLQGPLQKNLWGDELGPALDQGRSLADAIDSVPQGKGRAAVIDPLSQDIPADPNMLHAAEQATWGRPYGETAFEPRSPLPTERAGPWNPPEAHVSVPPEVPRVEVRGTSADAPVVSIKRGPNGEYLAVKDGSVVGKLESNLTPEQGVVLAERGMAEPAAVSNVSVDPSVRGTGIGNQLYQAWKKDHGGNIMPSGQTTADAWRWWKRNEPEKVRAWVEQEAQRVLTNPEVLNRITDDAVRRQVAEQVAVKENAPSVTGASEAMKPLPEAERPVPVDSVKYPRSPETIAEKAVQERAAEHMPSGMQDALDDFNGIRTEEEMAAKIAELPPNKKDISANHLNRRGLNPGMRMTSVLTNHPLLKFTQTIVQDAIAAAGQFSRKYLTADKEGLGPLYTKMSTNERIQAMDALKYGDKHQFKVNDSMMTGLGMTDVQKAFVNKFYEANDALWARYNGNLVANGMQPLHYREGHFPGVFKGAYKSLVKDADGSIIGVIAEDSHWGRQKAIKYLEEKMPGVSFVHQDRKGLGGIKGQSDMLSGMNDMIQLMAQHDPRFAEVQSLLAEAIRNKNENMFDFAKHKLAKKGVFGNEGNRPWVDAKANAENGFKALIQYMEEAALHHELFQPLNRLEKLYGDVELQKEMPNALREMQNHVKHTTGRNVNEIGNFLNKVLDKPFELVGVGPRIPLKVAQEVKHRMSQLFMGYGNFMFTAAQMLQPAQTGLPFMQLAANRIGKGIEHVTGSMAKGGSMFLLAELEHMTGKEMGILPQHLREAHHYAMERGLRQFSELEHAYSSTKSVGSRAFDGMVDANMKIGETMTRTPMFLAFVDLLQDSGYSKQAVYDIAENLTQVAMIDYHQSQRPRAYSSLGVMGQFAGGLTTFKHGYAGQQAKLAHEAFGASGAKRPNPIPAIQSVAAVIMLSGLTGAMFYDELDNIYGFLTDEFLGGRKTIRESFLSEAPEWIKSGGVATATGVGIQSKFSSANMVPDTLFKAMSPQIEAAFQIGTNAFDYAKNRDAQGERNLAMSVAPSSMRGYVEDKLAKDAEGFVIDKEGKRDLWRSPEDWEMRKKTGMRPNSEVIFKQQLYDARKKLKGDTDKLKEFNEEWSRREINGTLNKNTAPELVQKVLKRGGDPEALINRFGQSALEAKKTAKQRLEGTNPDSLSGMHRFKEFNKTPDVNKPGER